MFFLSDNAASPCPEVLAAVVAAAPASAAGYDGDAISARLDDAFGALFGWIAWKLASKPIAAEFGR